MIVAVFAGWLFFDRLGDRDLWGSHEARAAQNAQRFLTDGHWGLLRLYDDQPELQKPPLYYWLVALAAWLRGGTVDAWAVRLPAALSGLLTVAVVYGFLTSRGRPLAGSLAAGMLASANHFTWVARTGRVDVPLTVAVTVAVLALTPGGAGTGVPKPWKWLVGHVAIAAGILLKGPLGFILPLIAILSNRLFVAAGFSPRGLKPAATNQEEANQKSKRSVACGVLFIAVLACPWFFAAHLQSGGEFTRVFFWYHHLQRATGSAETLASHPWWFYGPRLMADWLPWSLAFPLAVWLPFRSRRFDPDARLGLAWGVSLLMLLSFSKFKRADYLLPAYPGIAIFLGCTLERAFVSWRWPRKRVWLTAGLAIVMGITLVAWTVVERTIVPRLDAEREKHSFAAATRDLAPQPEQILFFRVEDHLLAFHLRRPLNTFMEWENLNVWAGRPGPHFVLMPAECASEWREHVSAGTLEELLRYEDRTDRRRPRGLVLMRTQPAATADERAPTPSENRPRADQHAAAGVQPGGRPSSDRWRVGPRTGPARTAVRVDRHR